MSLKAIYENEADIPAEYKSLFVERNGQWEIQVEGMKTQADVDRLQEAAKKERNDHKDTKDKLRVFTDAFGDRDVDEIVADLDRIPELEAGQGDGGADEEKINKLVEARVNKEIVPLRRENDKLKKDNEELTATNSELLTAKTKRSVHDELRAAASKAKATDTAVDDILMYDGFFTVAEDGTVETNEASGTPGLSPEVWMQGMQEKRPHWFGQTKGAGSKGGALVDGEKNPFSHEHWNMTAQGQLVNANRARAEQLAAAAGTTIGGARPPAK